MKTIETSLNELLATAKEFVKIMEINKITSHYQISGENQCPVYSDVAIKFYQPSEDKKYCLYTLYTHLSIGKVEFGKYGCVSYNMGITVKELEDLNKQAKIILEELKTYSFKSDWEREALSIRNDIKRAKKEAKDKTAEYNELLNKIKEYQA
jgi:hypothetical protein